MVERMIRLTADMENRIREQIHSQVQAAIRIMCEEHEKKLDEQRLAAMEKELENKSAFYEAQKTYAKIEEDF